MFEMFEMFEMFGTNYFLISIIFLRTFTCGEKLHYLFKGMEKASNWLLKEMDLRLPSASLLPVRRRPGNLEKRCNPATTISSRVMINLGSSALSASYFFFR